MEHEGQLESVMAILMGPGGREPGANPEQEQPVASPEGAAPAKSAPRRTERTPEDWQAAGTEPGRMVEHQETQMVRAKLA